MGRWHVTMCVTKLQVVLVFFVTVWVGGTSHLCNQTVSTVEKKLKPFQITLNTFKDDNRWITGNSLNFIHPRYDAQTEETSSKLYRLDKDEEYSTLTTLWSNMAKLFKGDSDIDAQLRRQVVDLEPPVFSRKRRNDTVSMSSQTSDIAEYFTQQTPWVSVSRNLLAFYHEWRFLIGYVRFSLSVFIDLFCSRWRNSVRLLTNRRPLLWVCD